ncbi:hypothetical protein SARC_01966 [Sphaeroforma arctica JP610]|uniref:HotDog ACOT-type domain-containing protein n=1 Tax=Sphaeroforma arctica JP610 TaxID=667725 RepID=A0A0L0G9Z5_9EUKA|nr:hypothetical protein SARC_01966 [Sphaeroforma arctica JP610]KNC85857.1 hypothetical protein SARC_01966 [Sphaeroforma arctica JP610]|eukprot:XP_014159759.1 hypothetical protein SARC_01966 [Sphaeroforma arctica JP610]
MFALLTAERLLGGLRFLALKRPAFVSTLRAALLQPEVVSALAHGKRTKSNAVEDVHIHREEILGRGVQICQVLGPGDSNPAGNVHGGVVLKLAESAGYLAVARHCNANRTDDQPLVPYSARMEKSAFINPMYLGQCAVVNAKVAYASNRTVQVHVDVWAENLLSGHLTLCNQARIWYVAFRAGKDSEVPQRVPPVVPINDDEKQAYAEGQKEHATAKSLKHIQPVVSDLEDYRRGLGRETHLNDGDTRTVGWSFTELAQMVCPSHCEDNKATAGVIMKLMDTCAGIAAVRHARSNVVTVALSQMEFFKPINLGEIMSVSGRITYVSERSIEVEVIVTAYAPIETRKTDAKVRCVFSMVPLAWHGGALTIPKLQLLTDEEKVRFLRGEERYKARRTVSAAA